MPFIAPTQLKTSYDVIIVGAGSGGCVVARRLIDQTNARVLLVEAGRADHNAALLLDPTAWIPLAGGDYDWGLSYAPNPRLNNRRIPSPRGKVLGGSSAINAMMWYRGHPADYDRWDVPGWAWEDCLPAFKRCETWEEGPSDLRGGDGPLRINRSPDPHPVALAMIEGMAELGYARLDDPNGHSNDGVGLANYNIDAGKRWSSATGYLEPVLAHPNLSIVTETRAKRIIIEHDKAVAAELIIDDQPFVVEASSQIVLAAGAFETPRLLTLSGLADESALRRLGIDTQVHLPGVGQNLQDHPLLRAVNFRAKIPSGPTRDNGGGAIANVCSHSGRTQPDVHMLPIQQASGGPDLRQAYDTSGNVFALAPGVMDTKSVGSVTVTGDSPDDPLIIAPNFFDHSDDWQAMRFGVRLARDVARTKAFEHLYDGLAAPASLETDEEIDDFIRLACATFFHCCGTAKMGAAGDRMAVVDAGLNVLGVDGLMVADASIIPIIPTCNTHAPVTMIGERAADFLIDDLARHGFCSAVANSQAVPA
ncbi:MAG: GMC family oxidoreductase N-terminal domain-containing protein [Rhizobiales bacterium]|nr:GMC family oxidoreductase N-terminal domain-containing protein [Hyphomicrobiales bacterium]MBO6699006.1 GMC family oxidoreductase N-terminal domain-containing protein [Hyphomicrobiales bacterium]MBO6734741.1 GMC family oxidoreductase N-terminal domain-containing protein [Hyphomicrobiales bacterium]MBO6911453.1 GMC family oxidoreductase N-terminal domain-containing protein [Hyphomicrobiales bacterium]MBO6957033.1 GMC family oxidoreductase N-terminal domain-containing protein [Hyphomicrobiales